MDPFLKKSERELSGGDNNGWGLNLRIGGNTSSSRNVSSMQQQQPSTSLPQSRMLSPDDEDLERKTKKTEPTAPSIPDSINWESFLARYRSGKWVPGAEYDAFPNRQPDDEFYEGNTGSSVANVDFIMRPLVTVPSVVWRPLFHKRLERCGILHSGIRNFDRATGPCCPHGLRVSVYYVGWRYFLVVVLAIPPAKDEASCTFIGYHYVSIDREKALLMKFDA